MRINQEKRLTSRQSTKSSRKQEGLSWASICVNLQTPSTPPTAKAFSDHKGAPASCFNITHGTYVCTCIWKPRLNGLLHCSRLSIFKTNSVTEPV
ncbi:mCG7771 [Mus musculus]|nr:mCG7771 [Mus musculus]